ncbi:MAG: T9SS type A sorting domain-containing protein [Sphingobacteriaceae bacterium]|nr:MAG: T9SS type A sorting domain-containing protein [Sphingobacteriaceae bacterium]
MHSILKTAVRVCIRKLFGLMLLLSPFFYADAATVTSTANGGNWNDNTTWVGGAIPKSTDDVVISANATVTMDAANTSAGILSLTVSTGSILQTGATAGNIRFYIKGNIINNGNINFWLNSTQGSGITLTGNSSWSGSGTWNLAQLFIGNFALEFGADISVTINKSITVGSGSLNLANKRSNYTFVLSGPENITLASSNTAMFYGNIMIDKTNSSYGIFSITGTTSAYNTINVLGNITVNYGNELKVANYNLLDIKSAFSGSGKITGGTNSDIQISGTGAAILFNSGGSGFRNFTLSRPNGATIDSTITISQNLTLQNQAKLYMPAGKSANGNQTFTVGGAITGDGYLAQQNGTNAYQLTDLTLTGSAVANLRFSQATGENIIHNLTVNKASSTVNLLDGGFFQVKNTCTLTNGTFNINGGTLKLTGSVSMNANGNLTGSTSSNLIIGNDVSSSNATIYFNQTDATSRSLKTYTQSRNGTITLATPLEVVSLVDLNSNSTANILNSASNLTLVSTESNTARVNSLGSASIADSVLVQRFIKGSDLSRRSYRLLSSPVYQVPNANTGLRKYYFSRLQDQILITGAGGTANGFDASPANGPTIWRYNEPAANSAVQDFIPISSISKNHSVPAQTSLTAGNGFLLFFRGDRINNVYNKTTQPFPTPEDVILTYKGLLNQGNITVTAPYGAATGFLSFTSKSESNDGFNLIGNPYPSAVDWELSGGSGSAIALTNINSTIYILDPVTKNYGTYTKGGTSTGSATQYIASGQGFFVKANAANPVITFTEAAKASDTSNPAVLGGKTASNIDFLRLNLQKDTVDQDDILITFKQGQSEDFIAAEDVEDLAGQNAAASLSSISKKEKTKLAVNALPSVENVSTIPLFADAAADGNFTLKLADWSANFITQTVYLKDNFTGDSVELDKQLTYAFFIRKNTAATFGADRFVLYFKAKPVVVTVNNQNLINQPKTDSAVVSALLYPNPASAEINILVDKNSTPNIKLTIYSNKGQKVFSAVYQNQFTFKHNVTALPAGIYVAELLDLAHNNRSQKIKFIKN